jgi:tetratricopeptide (TPR) repeat protein
VVAERSPGWEDDRRLLDAIRRVSADVDEPELAPALSEPVLARYRIVRRLGEGGMGIVYEAEQQAPRRTVALKVLRPGVASPRTLRRFEVEAEILGRLDHPGIAKVYEAGSHDTGRGPQPWFAMEISHGMPVTEWVATQRPARRARLSLFNALCDAVHHAHQKGVVHRDLKPANVLVDATGRPKVLDFGVARVAGGEVGTTTLRTLEGQIVGTLPYMSPEQVSGDPEAVDIRADVYSLGVILYELLALRRPLDLEGKSLAEAARAIEELEPRRLGDLDPSLRGDLELIVSRALAKDRERRYDSAAALSADIERHLRSEPIAARPPSGLYQLGRFARRHRAFVAGLAGVFVALLLGLFTTLRQAARARAAEVKMAQALSQATADARRSRVAAGFLSSVIEQASPAEAEQIEPTVRDLLRVAARRVGEELGDDPEVEAQVRVALGRAFFALGELESGREHLERSLALAQAAFGSEHREVAYALTSLAQLAAYGGELTEAQGHVERVLTLQQAGAADTRDVAACLRALGSALYQNGRYEQAEQHYSKAIELFASLDLFDEVAITQSSLATALHALGDSERSEVLHREALAALRATRGDQSPFTANALELLARHILRQGETDEAEQLVREAMAIRLVRQGDEPGTAAACQESLALIAWTRRDLDSAETLLREALSGLRQSRGEHHGLTDQARVFLAQLLIEKNELEEAELLLTSVLTAAAERGGPPTAPSAGARSLLAVLLVQKGRPEEAEVLHDQALSQLALLFPPDHDQVLDARLNRGAFLTDIGRYEEAEQELLELYEHLVDLKGEESAMTGRARRSLIALYLASGRPQEAWDFEEP